MHTLKTTTIVSAAVLSLLLSACGGGGDSPLINPGNSSTASSGSVNTTDPAAIGFGSGSSFTEGAIGAGNTDLMPGASTNLTINIVSSTSTLVTTPIQVTFNSSCYASGEAVLSQGTEMTNKVTTDIGQASITYAAKGCVGDDQITATAIIGGVAKVARVTVKVAQDTVQSISFVDANPSKIFLKDSGGAQTSTVRFLVKGSTGTPIKNIPLNFSLSTQLGGIALTTSTATTDSTGHASTVVQAGTIPTAVEVIATDPTSNITARSNKLSIGTGMPDQNSMSISASRFNPPGWDYDGEPVNITIRLADAFNNPPADGTSVQFLTEGGSIDTNCTTINGACTVIWKSQSPRPSNGRVTILATTVGNESFKDVNGDGLYTANTDIFNSFNNGGNCNPNVPLSTAEATPGGNDEPCDDLGEAYLDENENGEFDTGAGAEDYVDFNMNGSRNIENGIYNGVLCSAEGSACTKQPVTIRQDIVLSMSSELPMTQNGRLLGQPEAIELSANETTMFTVTLADINGNAMPVGTTVSLSTSTASDVTINQSMNSGVASTLNPTAFTVTLKASETKRPSGSFNIVVTSPKGPSYSFSTRLIPRPLENTAAIYIGKSSGATFLVGQVDVGIEDAVLPPGGSTSLSVSFVDSNGSLTTGSATATFTSQCVRDGTAILTDSSGQPTSTASTQTGRATLFYKANGCIGTDLITATSTLPSLQVNTATATLNITVATAQNIVFDRANPAQISLKGGGGVETSDVRFIVNGPNGLPMSGVPVTLTLNNSVGGVCLISGATCTQEVLATSNASGIVSARVQAGTITTTVRVTASTESGGTTISTQSSGLVISTGIPDQDSMSISASQYNVPVYVEGFEVDVVIRMADAFNNPIPKDTSVSFTASGGSIDGSCATDISGSCTVKWRNQNPRPASGKVVILATALGNESFVDTNGNGTYDANDTFATGGGSCARNAPTPTLVDPSTACDDLGEAYLDSNWNDVYDLGEVFIDIFGPGSSLTKDGARTPANGVYDGALCPAGASSSTCTRNSVTVRQDLMLVLGAGVADTTGNRLIGQPANISMAANSIQTLPIILRDANGNSLPAGTTVTVNSTNLTGATVTLSPTAVTVASNVTGPTTFDLVVKRDATAASGQFKLVVTVPGRPAAEYTSTVTSL
ncbi:MAG: hypothetical protein Q7T48_00225 [Cellvibrio sp.]|uniref:hypothetical protein n=1 Tax=Cellvibrio sp. TaxID=1965322 RepID=UPI0027212F7B|nr:hypothetical protein [Cellvibrio sp.]